ncbi:DUF6691 family protein [Bradyrhizobium sp. LHD-71]|uniref:DUF6691 family protein n=1 Tax=Bradyrhizobium sp. LHD-71 TaxID=3072141 RepID=UPI00280E758D|nr:DUF6691 family protein [Bradyrhizobium sp. LHD-71]MDQ8726369.1 YeeE/YedE thiosulfate transporter family protein [Bradyrhizobium sp. LHD-71]
MKNISVFLIGCCFSLGLCISGLVAPRKVLAFLDLFGAWDPSLILTMAAGLVVAGISYLVTRGRRISALGEPMQIPSNTTIDVRLIVGSLLFGAGWGLAGVCPGPALVNLGFLSTPAAVFVAAMFCGMALFQAFDHWGTTQRPATVDA